MPGRRCATLLRMSEDMIARWNREAQEAKSRADAAVPTPPRPPEPSLAPGASAPMTPAPETDSPTTDPPRREVPVPALELDDVARAATDLDRRFGPPVGADATSRSRHAQSRGLVLVFLAMATTVFLDGAGIITLGLLALAVTLQMRWADRTSKAAIGWTLSAAAITLGALLMLSLLIAIARDVIAGG